MIESRNGKKEKQIILRLMLHLLDCQKERKNFASSGNRTRAARVAGEHSTTEPTMLTGAVESKPRYSISRTDTPSSCGRVVKATHSK